MFSIFKKKKEPEERSRVLTYFQVNHPLDIPYENDLNGKPTSDPEIQAELNRLVDLACLGVSPAKLQSVLAPKSGNPHDLFELGYLFGCLDVYKSLIWGVEGFNRSFFHCGLYSYFGNMDDANAALLGLGSSIANNDPEFMRATKIGQSDAKKMIDEKKTPSGLMDYFSKQL